MHRLTEREREIVLKVANGKKNRQIASELFIAMNTVKNHLKSIYRKLKVGNRAELTSKCFTQGWLEY